MRRPNLIFAVLCLASAAAMATLVYWAKTRVSDNTAAAPRNETPPSEVPPPAAVPTTSSSKDTTPLPRASKAGETEANGKSSAQSKATASDGVRHTASKQVFYRHNGIDSRYGRLAYVQLAHPEQPEFVDTLSCETAHVAGGRGICLGARRGVFTTYSAILFDAKTFEVLAQFPLKGVPSRSRVSVDGKLAALTVFVSGHGYESLDFSTQTLLIDVDSGSIIADLEEFSVSRNGLLFSSKDFNFWGVTFTPDTRNFYATLSTNRQHFLVKGEIAKRSAAVVHDNVECPSLSPDGTRVAYKKRFMAGNRVFWQLHILDLKTGKETALAEKRSVDDQLEWLDNDHVLYTLPESESGPSASTNIWLAGADGMSSPKLFLRKAYSPSVVPLP